jgi:hypothetical protein
MSKGDPNMYCSECGALCGAGAKFCSQCGGALQLVVPDEEMHVLEPAAEQAMLVPKDRMPAPPSFRNPTNLTRWLILFLCILVVVNAMATVSGVMQYQLLTDSVLAVRSSTPAVKTAVEANDERELIVGLLQLSVFLATYFLLLRWVFRANHNARQLGATGMRFTPGWCVGWFFVPGLNLWKPYQAMKEIWKASKNPANWEAQCGNPILGCWWFFWICSGLFGLSSFNLRMRAGGLDALATATAGQIVSDILSIPQLLITIVLVSRIREMQLSHILARD